MLGLYITIHIMGAVIYVVEAIIVKRELNPKTSTFVLAVVMTVAIWPILLIVFNWDDIKTFFKKGSGTKPSTPTIKKRK